MSAIFWCITVLVWATSLTVPHGRGNDAACQCLETTAKEAGSEGSGKDLTTCATPSTAGTLATSGGLGHFFKLGACRPGGCSSQQAESK